jgi:UDP-N-acetylglucosamine 3-dehydrogenase
MSSRLRIAVVGFGAIGRHHARNYAAMHDEVELVAVVEPNEENAAAARDANFPVVRDVEEVLSLAPDGVSICVPTADHERVAERFLGIKCGLLIEKPIAADVSAAERLVARCEESGTALMVGYVERYNPAVAALRDFIGQGYLGNLLSVSACRVGVLPPRIKDANVLVDIGVHDIDIAAFLTNSTLRLVSAQGGMAFLRDRLDYATLALDAGGVSVQIMTNWVTPVKIRTLSVTGTLGFAHVDYMTQEFRFASARTFDPTPTYDGLVEQYRAGELLAVPVQSREPLRAELEVFAAGLRGASLPDPRIAIESLRVAEEATTLIESEAPTLVTR